MKVGALLFGLAQLLRLRAATDADFRALLARRDATFQIGLADGTEGRYFVTRGGKVSVRGRRYIRVRTPPCSSPRPRPRRPS